MRVAAAVLFATALLFGTPAQAGNKGVHVNDLDRTTMPDRIRYSPGKRVFFVDGQPVRGALTKQLDYAAAVLAQADGQVPASLRLEDRKRLARKQTRGVALVTGAPYVLLAGLAITPAAVVVIPVAGGALAMEGTGLATIRPARKAFDDDGLADQVELLHLMRLDERRLAQLQ